MHGHAFTGWVKYFGLTRYTLHMYDINALRLWLNKRLRWLTDRLTCKTEKKYLYREINVWNRKKFLHIAEIADRIITWSICLFAVWFCDHFLVERHQIKLDTQKISSLSLLCDVRPVKMWYAQNTTQNNKRVALSKC